MTKEIQGAKKGGGGGRSAQEAPNTLRSSAVVRVVEVISEGEIVGLCGGPKGIYINDTPLISADDTENFPRATWDYRVGLPNQDYMPGYTDVEAETIVGSSVAFGSPVTRTTTSGTVDAAKVTIQLPQGLYGQNTTNGDLKGTSVEFTIETKLTSSGSWLAAQSFTIDGKTTTAYERQYRIGRPAGAGTWDIRVSRVTADSALSSLRNATTFARITEIQEIKDETTEYNNTAVIGLGIDAETVGGQIPTRSYMIQGIKCQVPSNYNTATRVYTGIWNGTFQTAWTDNPAWVLYDLLTNERYGLGEFVGAAQVDKYSFYDASVYNDADLVLDGSGNRVSGGLAVIKDAVTKYEARFTFNGVINAQDEAYRILQMVAGSMRGSLVYFNGLVTLVQDRPADPVKLVTKANVIDGMFDYKSTGLFERHTAFNITYNDRQDRFLQRVATIDASTTTGAFQTALAAAEAKYGYNAVDIAAYGATSEGQAIRQGRWALDTELNQTELAAWKMSLNGFDLLPGDIVKVYDEDYAAEVGAGRIVSVSGTPVIIDRNVTLTVGSKIEVMLADGITMEERNIVETSGTVSTFTISSAFSTAVLAGADYILTTTAAARQFKIIGLKQEDKHLVAVEAVLHDPNKYSRVEQDIDLPSTSFTNAAVAVTSAPTTLTFQESAVNIDNTIKRSLLISWQAPATGAAVYYTVQFRVDSSTWVNISEHATMSYELVNIQAGIYDVRVFAHSAFGQQSAPATGSYTILTAAGGASTLNAPTTLVEQNLGGTAFENVDLSVKWINPASNADVLTATLRDFEVTVTTTSNVALRTEYITAVDPGSTQYYSYSFVKNNADTNNVPNRSVKVKVRCRDTAGNYSSYVTTTFTNAAPAAPGSVTVSGGYANTVVKYNRVSDPDVSGYLVWGSTTNGFTPGAGNLLNDSADNYFVHSQLADNVTWYYKVAAYDTFGKSDSGTGMNLSAQVSATTANGANVNEWVLTGVTWKPNDPSTNSVSWTACTAAQTLGAGAGTTYSISAGNVAWTTGVVYIYYVPGNTTLSTTTTLATAVTGYIIASYRGGSNFEHGDGKAYTDGSLILAGTVGATQVVTSGLITLSAQINNAVINDAHFTGLLTAAKIDARGLSIKDAAGNVIFASGNSLDFNTRMAVGTTGVPSNNATADVSLRNHANCTITGNTITKTSGGSSWNASAYSYRPIVGGCFASCRLPSSSYRFMIALNTDPTSGSSHTTLDYALYAGSGTYEVYESGTLIGSYGTANTDDTLMVAYDNDYVRYSVNGTVIRSVKVGAGKVFYLDTTFYTENEYMSNVMFGPLSKSNSQGNLIDASWWHPSVSATTNGWYENAPGPGGSNSFGTRAGPSGNSEIVWNAVAGSGGGTSGGWNPGNSGTGFGNYFEVDITKPYRYCVPIRHSTASPSGVAFWGPQSNDVCNLNTTTPNSNPYFFSVAPAVPGRWYLFVGYVYPYGTTGNANAGGYYDMTTGALVAGGTSFNWAAGITASGTRAYQYYSTAGSIMYFCKPMVHIIDGSEPTLDSILSVGAPSGRNQITSTTASTYMASAAINLAQINTASIGSLSAITATIGTLRTATSGARVEILDNKIRVYDSSNTLRIKIGDLS